MSPAATAALSDAGELAVADVSWFELAGWHGTRGSCNRADRLLAPAVGRAGSNHSSHARDSKHGGRSAVVVSRGSGGSR